MERAADRREFLLATAAAAAVMCGVGPEERDVGIRSLKLNVARGKVAEMRRFYAQVLGLAVEDSGEGIVVLAGGTRIEFEPVGPTDPTRSVGVPKAEPEPYYHFAFNIPEHKLAAAKAWMLGRWPLLKKPDGGDEYHFVSWNAHAVYFLDPAGNILEFIARHNLRVGPGHAGEPFTSADILYASEIALVVDDVAAAVESAREKLGLGVFAGSQSEQFAAVGDDHRLLIIVKRGREWNSGDGRRAEAFPVRAEVVGSGRFESAAHQFEVVGA